MKDISNIKANFSMEIIIGAAACLIAVFIIVQTITDLISPLLVGFVSDEFIVTDPRFNLIIIVCWASP